MPRSRPIPTPVTRPARRDELRAGADPNNKDKNGETQLHYAVSNRQRWSVARVAAGIEYDDALDADIAELLRLLAAGADPNLSNIYGDTPLHYAADKDNSELTRLLLDAGADPDVRGFVGATALYKAVQNRRVESVELLLQHNADVRIEDMDGVVPIDNVRPGDTRILELLHGAARVAPCSFPRPGGVKP